MRTSSWVAVTLIAAAATGCPGKAPPDRVNADAAGAADADVDAGTETTAQLSGKVRDYFTNDPLSATAVITEALAPAQTATGGADGTYTFDVSVGSKLYLIASRASYRDTRNVPLSVFDIPVSADIFSASSADIARQYASVATAQASGTFLAIELQDTNGLPLTGVAPAAIQLLDGAGVAATGTAGPFFFGSVGDLDTTVTTSTAVGGRARTAYLNVSPGQYTVVVNTTLKTSVTITAGGATLALTGGVNSVAPPPPATPSFATDIWPKLQKASLGGLGCGNCHTANGPAGANTLPYDKDATTTLATIMATAGVVNTTTPATSLILTMPLYETPPTPQNHPNATFLDVNDANYKLFLQWITTGASP